MTAIPELAVVDVNVGVAANGHATVSLECQLECVETLEEIVRRGRVVLDTLEIIWTQYMNHLQIAGDPAIGDAFMRWIHEHQWISDRCESVPVTPVGPPRDFQEFPDDPALAAFDHSDRIYVAVAVAAAELLGPAVILNATDSDWKHHYTALQTNGISVINLCQGELKDDQ
jgi:hypothetical protein